MNIARRTRRAGRGTWGVVTLAAALLLGPLPVRASQAPAPDPLTQAQRLRDAGDLAAAARIFRAQLTQQPDNGDAARLLAQTLYWLKDIEGATTVYDAALARHPQDTTLRLQYGRMLAETEQRARVTG